MIKSAHPNLVTLVASPSPGGDAAPDPFVDDIRRELARRQSPRHIVEGVASVRDIDLTLTRLLADARPGGTRLQIIGHNLGGGLALGAVWIPEAELQARAFRIPYYLLDTNPSSRGLLSKHAGKISELMLVGCNIGSAESFGYAING